MAQWLVTRPDPDAGPVLEALAARGVGGLAAPLMRIAWRDVMAPELDGVQTILFTSANGVRAYVRLSARRDRPVFAVGDATAAEARAAGFARVQSAGGDIHDLAALLARRCRPRDGALLHVAGSHVAGDLGALLAEAGLTVRRAVLYEAVAADRLPETAATALRTGRVTGVLFFSPRTAALFARLVVAAGLVQCLKPLTALCLSPAVASRLDGLGWRDVRVAPRPDMPALLALLDAAPASSPDGP